MMSRAAWIKVASLTLLLGAVVAAGTSRAQMEAPGQPIVIPGIEIPGWGQVVQVPGRFGVPASAAARIPAVLILHGSGGVDGRGAYYARALQEAGIATLEITMFTHGNRPKGSDANMPHVAAALKWLAEHPVVDGDRLGVMGFSWGGGLSVLISSETVQSRLGRDVPKPAALVSLYPVCTNLARNLANPQRAFYNAQTRMSATPMMIFVGTRDDYEEGARPCDGLLATWPPAAREVTTVRYLEGATHGFDSQTGPKHFDDDPLAHAGKGGMVNVIPDPSTAAEVRQAVTGFFLENLKR
jgi:dienelactone hydrolase